MARQYSRRTFLRQTPRAILKDYFAKKGLLGPIVELCSGQPEEHAAPSPETPPTTPPPGGGEKDVGDVFDAMGKKKGSDAISDAIENLPDAQRAQIDADFEVINELAYEHGVEAILEEATFWRLDWVDRFSQMSNHYERSFRAFLDDPDLFYRAGQLDEMDRVGSWESRIIYKDLVPKVEQADLDALAAAVGKLYRKQGRGRYCAVDNYLRHNPERHCYFLYPEDHAITEPSFDGDGKLQQLPRRPVFEIIFVYRPDNGLLELCARGNSDQKVELMTALCKTILGLDVLPPKNPLPDYDLAGLKSRTMPFPTDVQDGIEGVEVRLVRLGLSGGSRRITLEANPSPHAPQALYDLVDDALNQDNVPLDSVLVDRARIRITFTSQTGRRQKKLTFEVGHLISDN